LSYGLASFSGLLYEPSSPAAAKTPRKIGDNDGETEEDLLLEAIDVYNTEGRHRPEYVQSPSPSKHYRIAGSGDERDYGTSEFQVMMDEEEIQPDDSISSINRTILPASPTPSWLAQPSPVPRSPADRDLGAPSPTLRPPLSAAKRFHQPKLEEEGSTKTVLTNEALDATWREVDYATLTKSTNSLLRSSFEVQTVPASEPTQMVRTSNDALAFPDSGDDGEDEELDLLYDPVLNCYYDPCTNQYYECFGTEITT